jgi:predicted GIY-YIG superfamily endonuclease
MLIENKKNNFDETCENCYGNYLITDTTGNWSYTGEGKNLAKRLKQHSKERTSTFFKNYLKANRLSKILKLGDFNFRIIPTAIGRKELEEFTIVNYPTNLNNFQKGKRNKILIKADKKLWTNIQENSAEIIKQGEKEFAKIRNSNWSSAQIMPGAGIYWIEHKKDGHIYIGESSDVSKRHLTHSGKTYFSAVRRNLGETILEFKLQTIKGKKRYFSDNEDEKVNKYLKDCTIKTMPISFGRFELEEYLIKKHKPVLNRKENK